jgi:hypothetical protein
MDLQPGDIHRLDHALPPHSTGLVGNGGTTDGRGRRPRFWG